jgi:hypothetical protein
LINPQSHGSNQSIHSSEEDEERLERQERAFMNPSSTSATDLSLDFRVQQKDLLERLKEQFTNFPFSKGYPEIDLSAQAAAKLHQDSVKNDFALAFSSPTSIKNGEFISIQICRNY